MISNGVRSFHTGEDIAHKVAERLRLEVESQDATEKRQMDEEASQEQAQEEQRKRWMSLRGGGVTSSNTPVEHDPVKIPTGRGRGRGVMGMNNLRRPGEVLSPGRSPERQQTESSSTVNHSDKVNIVKPPPGFGRGVGRGTKLHLNTNMYASSVAAPHASEAPKPPTAWTN